MEHSATVYTEIPLQNCIQLFKLTLLDEFCKFEQQDRTVILVVTANLHIGKEKKSTSLQFWT